MMLNSKPAEPVKPFMEEGGNFYDLYRRIQRAYRIHIPTNEEILGSVITWESNGLDL